MVEEGPGLDDFTDELARRIESWTGNHGQVIGRRPEEIRRLASADEPILAGRERELVVIYGDRSVLTGSA